jgi:hypothetical protein
MHLRVTCSAQCDEVLLGIVSGLTSMLFMVNLKIRPCTASLASARLVDTIACTIRDQAADADVLVDTRWLSRGRDSRSSMFLDAAWWMREMPRLCGFWKCVGFAIWRRARCTAAATVGD